MFSYRLDVILSHKKFTGTDFGRVYIPYIPPVATPLKIGRRNGTVKAVR